MLLFICGIILALFSASFLVLYRTYSRIPLRELKRQARRGDEVARLLYKTVSYGLSAAVLLIVAALTCLYFAFVLLDSAVGKWLAVPTLLLVGIFALYFVQAHGGLHPASVWLASKASPSVAWLAERLHPLLKGIERTVRRLLPIRVHSGLYEKEDLAALLQQQKGQPDNRIDTAEIDLLTHALTFGDKTVADALTPRRVVADVSVDASVGPVLMGELHKSGHSRFPVYESRHDNIVGIVYLHDLVHAKDAGTIRSIMRPQVMYVHENFTLFQTLQAFVKTKQHLYIVVNEFEEYVGIITIEDVLERVIGKLIVDEFDRYDDLRAVAAAAAKKELAKKIEQGKDTASHTDASSVPAPVDSPRDIAL